MSASSDREQSRLFSPMSEEIESYRIRPIARVVYGNPFELSIVALIVANAAALAALTFSQVTGATRDVLLAFDSLVIWVFVAELLVRIASYGKKPWMFFTSGWNVFDFLIIALVPFFAGATIVLRLLRLLRVVRLFRFMPEFKILSNSLARSIKPLLSLVVLIGFLMFLFGMAGVYLFGPDNPESWGDIGLAMVTLTILLTLENFPDSFEAGLETTPFAWLYFVAFMFLVVFTVLNVLIGIVLNAMDEARAAAEDDDAKLASALTLLESAHTSGSLSEDATARLQKLLR
jgi:voltage-gated sodium channel